jgi:hypothetical protein
MGVFMLVPGIVVSLLLLTIPSQAAKPGSSPSDLSGVTQNWDKKLPNEARFTILADFNNQAVRDNETGLVWERSPNGSQYTWVDAVRTCWMIEVGGRTGWHLPTIEELASLVDRSAISSGLILPLGHPFLNIQPSTYWSTTTDVRPQFLPSQAWVVRFNGGDFGVSIGDNDKSTPNYRWCVRGGTHADKYK